MTFKQFLDTEFDRALKEGWSGKWLNQKLSDSYAIWQAKEKVAADKELRNAEEAYREARCEKRATCN